MTTTETRTLPCGVHTDAPFSTYLATEAWGSSALKAMRHGPPARVLYEKECERADTSSTILGTAVHCALLTPDLFDAQFAVKPGGMTFSSRAGKGWRDDPERAGKTILSHEAAAQVDAIVDSLLSKSAVAKSLDASTHREVSIVWSCSSTREPCKARPDWMDARFIYDLKVSRHAAQWDRLGWRAYIEGWMHQGAHYRTGAVEAGLGALGSRLVVVDPTPPHFVYTLGVETQALDVLEWENIETLRKLRECRLSGSYPGTPEEWKKIKLPESVLSQMGDGFGAGDDNEESEEPF